MLGWMLVLITVVAVAKVMRGAVRLKEREKRILGRESTDSRRTSRVLTVR